MSYNWGNKFHSKNWTPELRQKAYHSYLGHLADGFCIDSWVYDDEDGNTLSYKTMLNWIRDFPEEFPSYTLQKAKSIGKRKWEKVLYDSAEGKNKDANPASLQMIMRNKYQWDRPEQPGSQISGEVMEKFSSAMNLLNSIQNKS